MGELKRFSRNTFFLAISYAVRFGAGILVTILVGKNVAQEDFGRFAFALTLSTFFGVAADFGLPALTVRDVARDHRLAARYYRNVLALKIIFSVVGFAAVVAFMNLLGYPADTRRVVYPVAAFTFIASLGSYHYFLFRGLEQMQFEAAGSAIHNVILTAAVAGALLISAGEDYVPVGRVTTGYLLAGAISTALIVALFSRRAGGLRLSIDPRFWRVLLGRAGYFVLYGFLGLIYMQADTVMLSKLRADPETEMAIYQAPVKLLSAVMLVMGVLISVFMPMLSRRFKGPIDDFRALVHTLNRIGITIVAPIVVFSFLFSEQIMIFLFRSDYASSAPILMILSVGFLVWNGPPYGVVFVSMGRQSINFGVSAICAAVNILLNFIFIPMYGPLGAAATTLATYVLMKALYVYFCRKHLGSIFINRRYFTALALCAVLGAGLKWAGLHVMVAGAIFCAAYAAGSYLFVLSSAEKTLCARLLGTLKGEEVAA